MSTQREFARQGIITAQMQTGAVDAKVAAEFVRQMVAVGKIVIPWNHSRQPKAVGIGRGLRTKVNASIGTRSDIVDYAAEISKAKAAAHAGAGKLFAGDLKGDKI